MVQRRQRLGTALTACCASLMVVACGTTTTAGRTAAGGAGGPGATDGTLDSSSSGGALSGPTGAVGGGESGSGGLTATGPGGAGAGGAVTGGSGPSGRGGASTTSSAPFGGSGVGKVGASGLGVTKDTITIGAEYFSGADEAIADAGIKSVTTGDGRRQTQIIVDHINAQGGVAGRKLKVVFHDYNGTKPGADSDLAACSKFTEDNKLFAVLSSFNSHSDNFRSCLNKAGTLLLSDTSPSFDNKTMAQFPTFLPILALSLDRRITANVQGLARQRYFTPWDPNLAAPAAVGAAKIGLVSLDLPVYTRHIPQYESELRQRGQKLALEVRIQNQADIASAVLRFKSDGITHVMFSQEGAVAGLFAAAAVNQEYYPRYAMDTKDFPQIVLENVPQHKAFNGLLGIGWSPTTDVKVRPPLGPQREACLQVFRKQGVETTSNNQVSVLMILCDYFFYFDRVASLAGPDLNANSFLRAANQVRGQQFSYLAFSLNLERHRDGIASVADLEYNKECDCIRYTRFGIPVP